MSMDCLHEWVYSTDQWDVPAFRQCAKCKKEQWKHYLGPQDIDVAPWSDTYFRHDEIKKRLEREAKLEDAA